MTKTVLHTADSRGKADLGWLKSRHTFSFAEYYDPNRIHFGALRVINDDFVSGGMGFGTHPHKNMEIISIPTEGEIEHKDSMGNHGIISAGEIQVMSAGTGIHHSEFNHNKDRDLRFFQIWVIPNAMEVQPRYEQKNIPTSVRNSWVQILSPNAGEEGVWIHQNAWFQMATLDTGTSIRYALKNPSTNGVYAMMIEGEATINGQKLHRRDGFGLWDLSELNVTADSEAKILLMEVPMDLG